MKKLSALLLLLLVTGCNCPGNQTADPVTKIQGVERILMHGECYYHIFAKVEATPEIKSIPFRCENPKLIADVPDEGNMWVAYKSHPASDGCGYRGKNTIDGKSYHIYDAEFHIHSGRDIGGAGWNHGKQGSGTTEILQ